MLYVKNLYKSYQTEKNKYQVLNGVDFCVEKGEFVAVMGPSGSGKTTLLNCISCYIPFDKGEITIGGTNLAGLDDAGLAHFRNTQLGFVFQDFMLLDGLTIRENILVPRIVQGEVSGDAEELTDRLTGSFRHPAYRSQIPGRDLRRRETTGGRGAQPDQQSPDHPCRRTYRQSGFQVQPRRDRELRGGKETHGRYNLYGNPRQLCRFLLRPRDPFKRRFHLPPAGAAG